MDKDRAKFVLRSFRPDGADSQNVDFADALSLAISDRELGEWLMRERAFDADFSEALARIELPEGLREKVSLAMMQDGGGFPQADSKHDSAMISAIAAIEIPDDLREKVIEAMEHTAKAEQKLIAWKRISIPVAAAAGISLAFNLVDGVKRDDSLANFKAPNRISVEALQAGFVRIHDSPIFSLDQESIELPHMVSYLRKKGLPCGGGYLPPGLKGLKGIGCRELVIDGIRGSLICFDTEHGTVHLVILRSTDVASELPDMEHPVIEQSGNWAKACWCKEKYTFSLMAMTDKSSLASFF